MDNILQWCASNIALLIALVIGAANLLVSIFRKKAKIVDSVNEFILDRLPLLIASAERLFNGGEDKKNYVLMELSILLEHEKHVDIADYYDFASRSIEKILSTPQKKEEN